MKKIFLISFVIALSFLSPEFTWACICGGDPRKLRPEEFRELIAKELEKASTVFRGEVVESDRFRVKFKVEKLWKGDSDGEIILFTGAKDNGDGTYIHQSSCDYRFKLGERLLVYAYGDTDGLKTHRCSRTRPLTDAEVDIRELDAINPHEVKHVPGDDNEP